MGIPLSAAIEEFLTVRQINGCSPYTLRNYRLDLQRFAQFVGPDTFVSTITVEHVRNFLAALQTTPSEPCGIAPRPPRLLSPKTIRNVHTTLRSFWRYLIEEGYVRSNIIASVRPPQSPQPAIQPLTRDEVLAILRAIDRSAPYRNRPDVSNVRPALLRNRDRAIILVLLDTGVRAGELCALRVEDYNPATGAIVVRGKSRLHSGRGRQRVVYAEQPTHRALRAYLALRNAHADEPLFATQEGKPLTRRHLALHLKRIGQRAGIPNLHPHRLRHTYAIEYLRNGGDPYTLQRLLGHSTLEMVRRYLAISQADCAAVHRRCSPVVNWL